MKLLDAGYYAAKIARILGKSRSTVYFHLRRLETAGLIESSKQPRFSKGKIETERKPCVKFYRLTGLCSSFLDGFEKRGGRERVVRLHNLVVKYPILREPRIRVDWRRVELAHWTQQLGRVEGLTVRKNQGSIEIFARVVSGRDPYQLLFVAKEEADRVAVLLEQRFDMLLGRGQLSRRPHFGVYDAVAAQYGERFELSDDVAKIDESEGYGEIDWYSPEAAKDYLLMPANVDRLAEDVREIKSGYALFAEGMVEHMKLIRMLQRVVEGLQKAMPQRARGQRGRPKQRGGKTQ